MQFQDKSKPELVRFTAYVCVKLQVRVEKTVDKKGHRRRLSSGDKKGHRRRLSGGLTKFYSNIGKSKDSTNKEKVVNFKDQSLYFYLV